MNESTLNVELFNTEKRGQAVGLNYFSSISNDINTKINDKFIEEIGNNQSNLILYKNDIIKVNDSKNLKEEYYIFNGGGKINVANKLTIKNINKNSFYKIDRKGNKKEIKEDAVSPGKNTVISIVNIDFFGNIKEG